MAVKLIANYAKKLGLPGYSSHQFSISVETELTNVEDIAGTSERLYKQLQEAVDEQMQNYGYVPPDGYGMAPETDRAPQNGAAANGRSRNGNGSNGAAGGGNGYHPPAPQADRWNCTEGQKGLVIRLVHEHQLDKNDVEAMARQLFGCGVTAMDKMQASQLIEDLLEDYISIGRDAENGLQIDHHSVSGEHAALIRGEDSFRITDRMSTNGTWVNDRRVSSERLQDGDEVRFGDVAATFQSGLNVGTIGSPVRLSPPLQTPRKSKIGRYVAVGCVGVSVLGIVLCVLAFLWLQTAIKVSDNGEMLAALTARIPQKLEHDLNQGIPPSFVLGEAIELFGKIPTGPEFAEYPSDVREAFLELLTALRALKSEADALPKSEGEKLLRGLLNVLRGQSDGGYGETMEHWNARVSAVQKAQSKLEEAARRSRRGQ